MGVYKPKDHSKYLMSVMVDGRRFTKTTRARDRKLAQKIFKKWENQILEGKFLGKRKLTLLSTAFALYIKNYARPSKISWKGDAAMLKRFQEAMEETYGTTVTVDRITRMDIESFKATLKGQPLSNARVNRFLSCIRTAFNRLMDWDIAESNPVKGVKFFQEVGRTAYLETGQIRALLSACSERLRPLVHAALLTGLRRGDLLRLRWVDLNFEDRALTVIQSKTKTMLSFPMSEDLVGVLKSLPKHPTCPYVFSNSGKPFSKYGWIRGDFETALKEIGIAKFQFRDLRRTCGTQQALMGTNLKVISELLGHSSTRMTERYCQVSQSTKKEAVDRLGERIAWTPTKQAVLDTVCAIDENNDGRH